MAIQRPAKAALYGILPQAAAQVPTMVLMKPMAITKQKAVVNIPIEDDPEWILPVDFPNDTLVCLQALRNAFPPILNFPPVVMKTHFHQMHSNRAEGESQLTELAETHKIKKLKNIGEVDEYMFILIDDMISIIKTLQASASVMKSRLLDIFLEKVVLATHECFIEREQLSTLLFDGVRTLNEEHHQTSLAATYHSASSSAVVGSSLSMGKRKRIPKEKENKDVQKKLTKIENKLTVEDAITLLVQFGLLVAKDEKSFYFSVPGIGALLAALRNGRKEVLGFLNKSKWKEIQYEHLLEKKLKTTPFPVTYHLDDCLGKGLVEKFDTASGTFIRLRR